MTKQGNIPWNKGLTKETDSRIIAGENHPLYGKPRTEATKKKMSDTAKERLKNPENHPMYGKKGKASPNYGKRGEGVTMYGKKHTEETKKRMSESHKRENLSEETRRKISEAQMGEKNPNWIDGRSYIPYPFDFNEELRELIKERDGYMCQFPDCGTDIDLAVHHMDYDKMNNDTKNLITLCRSHNGKVNFNREYWTEHFMEMT